MAQSRFYSATAQPTVLTSGITPTTTSIALQATTGFPSSTPFILALDYNTPSEEIVLCTALAGTNATVTRAYDGTSATSHNAGAGVRHTWTAMDGNDSRAHEAGTIVHGVSSALVGVSDTQTLTSKTLTSPIINGTVSGSATYTSPTITGTVSGSATYINETVSPATAAGQAITVKGLASQTGDLQRWTDSSSTLLSAVDSGGVPHFFQGAQVGFTNQFVIGGNGIPHANAGLDAGSADQFTVDASGNFASTGAFNGASNVNTGSWTSYTPTWTASTTNPAIGNGTIVGRYNRIGKQVTVMINIMMGSTTTFGSGVYSFGLPFTSASIATVTWIGSARGVFIGNALFPAVCANDNNTNTISCTSSTTAGGGSSTSWSNTVPFTWHNGDIMSMSITYEVP